MQLKNNFLENYLKIFPTPQSVGIFFNKDDFSRLLKYNELA